jgi:hypothetical protein
MATEALDLDDGLGRIMLEVIKFPYDNLGKL